MYPPREAFRLLNKWKNEQASIRLLVTLSFGVGSFVGKVAAVEGTNVRFVSADASSDFLFSLAAGHFDRRTTRQDQPIARRRRASPLHRLCRRDADRPKRGRDGASG